jgi:hypothetical protein
VRKLAVVLHLSIQRRFLNGQRLEIVRITGFHLKLLRLRVTVGISRAHVPFPKSGAPPLAALARSSLIPSASR